LRQPRVVASSKATRISLMYVCLFLFITLMGHT